MNIRLYDPAGTQGGLLGRLHDEINRIFEPATGLSELAGATGVWSPAVDIREEESRYIIRADVPGVKVQHVDVTLERGVLTIAGKRESDTREEREGYRRVERFRGDFARHFALPDTADEAKVDARLADGVLEVIISKKESSKPRRIAVQN